MFVRSLDSIAAGASTYRAAIVCVAICGASLGACSGRDPSVTGDADAAVAAPIATPDAGPPIPPIATCTPENRFCEPAPPMSSAPACGNMAINIEPVGVNVMIAVDGSKAMSNHWEAMQGALKKMIEDNISLNFGAHLFYADVADFQGIIDNFNFCGKTVNGVLDVGPDQQTKVLPFIGAAPPGPGSDFFSFRPLVEPLNYYLTNTTKLADPKATNYLVVISNGADNCFGTAFANNADKLLAYEKLAVELGKRNIRILPIGFDGATAQKVPRPGGGGTLMTNFEALDVLAKFGGAGLTKALAADSTQGLEEAIAAVSRTVRTCRFSVPDVLDPAKNLNPFTLQFLVNGVQVPRDRLHKNGWDFLNGNTSQAEAFGEPCDAIRAGKPLTAQTLCSSEAVCGNAATRITTRPRGIQFVLDASLSMLACSDPDLFQCFPKDLGGADALNWWEVAVRSVTTSVVSTVNDDAEFGLQFLPGRNTAIGSCDPAPMPEVPVHAGAAIQVIGSALSTLPLGSTPLVATLENLANMPGRVGDPGISGAIVVMSDGGNGCGDIMPDEAARRLGEAAKKLSAMGVKIFVVKMGAGQVPEENAQLQAIASNGGAPQNMMGSGNAYLEAVTPDKLNEVLATVWDQLPTCELQIGEAPMGADSSKVNLYIDGAQILFDATGVKRDGWGYTDTGMKKITLYGEACTQFKKSRATSIVVEYGCPPAPVLL
jgi:hypothetical protein